MEAVLRPMVAADLPAVQALGVGGNVLSDGLIVQEAFVGIVAVLEAAVVGYIAGFSVAGEGEIIDVAVAEAQRRRGIGRALVRRFCAEYGRLATHLEVAEDNLAARRLYADLGFRESGRRAHYYGGAAAGRISALRMVRAYDQSV